MRYGSAVLEEREERGVYWARHTKQGCPICYAVDSKGDRIRSYYVRPTSDPDAAVDALWRYLDEVDPIPKLELVRDAPPRMLSVEELNRIYRESSEFWSWRHSNNKAVRRGDVTRENIKLDLLPRRRH